MRYTTGVADYEEADALDEGNDFMELLQLQDSLDMVTKTELLEHVRARGASISDRQLTTFVTEGLVPKLARIGSRGSAYPKIVEELVLFILSCRDAGQSVQAIKELLPVWKYLHGAVRKGELSLKDFEQVAREHVTLPEAAYAVPVVMRGAFGCPNCRAAGHVPDVKIILKNDDRIAISSPDPVSVGFVLAKVDEETGNPVVIGSMRIALALAEEQTSPSTVILGIPPGVELPCSASCTDEGTGASA
jgi:DNA-binding transcriptional MerR regulator